MERNIKLAYILAFLKTSWFWLGVWVFYYLLFTNYAGIGFIESVLIVTMTISEIPSGAFADLFGKKRTLGIAFALMAIGNATMALAPSFSVLAISVLIGGLGATFYSGTFDALVYDSLKQLNKEGSYDKVAANVNSVSLVAMAVAGLLSGVMYGISPRLPFFAVALANIIGLVLTIYLVEPKVDTEKFSLKNYLKQNSEGLVQLKNLFKKERLAILLLSVLSLWVISDEMLESILSVEFGFKEQIIGIFFTVVFLVASLASQITPYLRKKLGEGRSVYLLLLLMALTYLASPLAGIVLGGTLIIFRESIARNLQNMTTVILNKHIEPKYRATTLSSYNLVKNIPYVLTAFAIGSLMDVISAKNFAFILGALILVFVIVFYFSRIATAYSGVKRGKS